MYASSNSSAYAVNRDVSKQARVLQTLDLGGVTLAESRILELIAHSIFNFRFMTFLCVTARLRPVAGASSPKGGMFLPSVSESQRKK